MLKKYKKILKTKKGVAGLEILLSMVTVLFVLGLLVMIFVVTGAGILDNQADLMYNGSSESPELSTAGHVVNDTNNAISSVVDWFPIIIVLGAVVVLILMAVLIISAIRGTGMMGGSSGESGRGDYA